MPVGSTAKKLNQAIYNQYLDRLANRKAEEAGPEALSREDFKKSCATDGAEGGLDVCDPSFRPRSLRTTEDLVASLKQSYSLISDHNNGTLVGSTDRPSWFGMTKEERSAVLKKWKRVGLSETSYNLLGDIFEDDPSNTPVSGGISLGSEKRKREGNFPCGSAQKKNKQNDLVEAMQAIMDGAVANMRVLANEDRERFIQHQKEENERNRELLRSLFGKD